MSRIIFFCHDKKELIEKYEYYNQDIDSLRKLNHEVIICTKYSEIPFKFDVIFIWWWTYALFPVILCKLLNKPSIITGTFNFKYANDYDGRDFFKRSLFQRVIITLAIKLASINLFVSRTEFYNCMNYFKLKRAYYFPHIISNDYLRGSLPKKANSIFNISGSSLKNITRKGIPDIIKAAKILKEREISFTIKLAGMNGDGVPFLLKMIEDFNLQNEILYLGEIDKDEKIYLMRTSDIYVQPSYFEGFGVAIAEAMGCGSAIITCDVGAVKEVVADNAIFISPGSPEELADAIILLLQDTKLRCDLQDKGTIHIQNNFAANIKIKTLKKIFAENNIF
jgi:glycosyltransferase involved in cell wall biosynthesis